GLKGKRDPKTFRLIYDIDPDRKVYINLFGAGYRYHVLGLIPTTTHLIGFDEERPENGIFLLGTDLLGRGVWSRLMLATRTSLSFLSLGLRPPAISWGVLLQDAQNIQTLVIAPWLLAASIPVIIVILAFNFLGDGLRDAADPYG